MALIPILENIPAIVRFLLIFALMLIAIRKKLSLGMLFYWEQWSWV
jgi:hypothetical protein